MAKKKDQPVISPIQPFKATKEHQDKKVRAAIKLLNEIVKIKLAPSPIHGIGVFAMRNIKKGEKLYTDIIPHQFDVPYEKFNKLRKDVAEQVLGHFPLIVRGSHFLYPVTKMSAYLNHHDQPNYDGRKDVALRDIKKNEEIVEDYRQIPGWQKVYSWLDK